MSASGIPKIMHYGVLIDMLYSLVIDTWKYATERDHQDIKTSHLAETENPSLTVTKAPLPVVSGSYNRAISEAGFQLPCLQSNIDTQGGGSQK